MPESKDRNENRESRGYWCWDLFSVSYSALLSALLRFRRIQILLRMGVTDRPEMAFSSRAAPPWGLLFPFSYLLC